MCEEVEKVKMNKEKFNIARAKTCKGLKELEAAGIPRGTLCTAMSGKNMKPETIGRIARALGVDVTEILEIENK